MTQTATTMEHTPVNSSNLASAGYDPEAQTLEIAFNNGRVYQYLNVPPEAFEDFNKAESKGSFFAKTIRGRYEAKRIDSDIYDVG
jgi:hypothetical protein